MDEGAHFREFVQAAGQVDPARATRMIVARDHLEAAVLIVKDVLPVATRWDQDGRLVPVLVAVYQQLMAGERDG